MEAIAGPPAASLSGAGTARFSDAAPAMSGTLIIVGTSPRPSDDYISFAGLGTGSVAERIASISAHAEGHSYARFDQGEPNEGTSTPGTVHLHPPLGRGLDVLAVVLDNNTGQGSFRSVHGEHRSRAVTPGTKTFDGLMHTTRPYWTPIVAHVWPRALADAEVLMVMGWLVRRYGLENSGGGGRPKQPSRRAGLGLAA
ncbi:hypothetical protein GCM10011333_11690 [Sediminivirga luteola]|uniref:Uncharacterized protein n=2 Tax=Sediminivirga luteola TaxID=1774748 RepID=A0A8J2XK05_9MICO|nr:hypothetical protein GCM10011333_11690 [Sediminivirga luteola]